MSRNTILALALAGVTLAAVAIGQNVVLGKNGSAPQRILLRAEAGKFNGENPTFEVRRGVPVELTVRNEEPAGIPHDFLLVGLDVRTPKALQPGESTTLRFTPSRSGEFAYTCTLHPGLMDGRMIVRP